MYRVDPLTPFDVSDTLSVGTPYVTDTIKEWIHPDHDGVVMP